MQSHPTFLEMTTFCASPYVFMDVDITTVLLNWSDLAESRNYGIASSEEGGEPLIFHGSGSCEDGFVKCDSFQKYIANLKCLEGR